MHLYFTRKCTCHASCSGGSFFTKAPGLILVDACCTKFNAINRPPPPSSAPHIQKICHSLLYLACTRLSGAMRMTINFWFFICLRRLNASNVGLRPPLPAELYLLINIILDTPLCIYNSFLLRSGRCFYLYTFHTPRANMFRVSLVLSPFFSSPLSRWSALIAPDDMHDVVHKCFFRSVNSVSLISAACPSKSETMAQRHY